MIFRHQRSLTSVKALAGPRRSLRHAILAALPSEKRSVKDLLDKQSSVSPVSPDHLHCLLDRGLASRRSEGRFFRYCLADERIAGLIQDADRLLASTATGLDNCKRYTE